jgi:hypothetical protein
MLHPVCSLHSLRLIMYIIDFIYVYVFVCLWVAVWYLGRKNKHQIKLAGVNVIDWTNTYPLNVELPWQDWERVRKCSSEFDVKLTDEVKKKILNIPQPDGCLVWDFYQNQNSWIEISEGGKRFYGVPKTTTNHSPPNRHTVSGIVLETLNHVGFRIAYNSPIISWWPTMKSLVVRSRSDKNVSDFQTDTLKFRNSDLY